MNCDRSSGPDALISIESTAEWQIHDIRYDGQERYVAPLTFSDYVAKYARKIDWRKLVGYDCSAIEYSEEEEESQITQESKPYSSGAAAREPQLSQGADATDSQQDQLSHATKEEADATPGQSSEGNAEKLQEKRAEGADDWPAVTSAKDKEIDGDVGEMQQGVGPWDSVAKRLIQSLTEMNALLDAIQVARQGKYMFLDTVAPQEPPDINKHAVFSAKKSSLSSASMVLTTLTEQLRPKNAPPVTQLDPDLEELIELRRNWRLKKIGNAILGDLSYVSLGKYRPNAVFEVKKTDSAATVNGKPTGKRQAWEIVLPKDLETATCLAVSIEGPLVQASVKYCGKKQHSTDASAYMWQEQLEIAQRTLLCRDLFSQLAREAAHVARLCCTVRGDSVTVNLSDGHSLTINLQPLDQLSDETNAAAEAQNSDAADNRQPTLQAFVLEHNLYQLFNTELESANEVFIGRPVSAPLTHLSKRARVAGPEALSVDVLASEKDVDKLLIQRVIDQASHFLLYQRTKLAIETFAAQFHGPSIFVHWCPETTGTWSLAHIHIWTPSYESCGKTVMMVEIEINSVQVTLRDGELVSLSSNLHDFTRLLHLQARQHIISAVGTMCRPHQWQTLYSNPCAIDDSGVLAPAILIVHPAGKHAVSVKYPINGQPLVYVQSIAKEPRCFKSELLSSTGETNDHWRYMRKELRQINYNQLPGTNFLHKLELLIFSLT